MATVDYGVIVRTDDTWVHVRPRCPYCGYMEESDWNNVIMGIPRMMYSRTTHGYTCHKCRKSFTISVYPG